MLSGCLLEAPRHRVHVVADMGVHVTAAVVERREGVGARGCPPPVRGVEAEAAVRDADAVMSDPRLHAGGEHGSDRDHVRVGEALFYIGSEALHAVVGVPWIHVGARRRLAGLLAVRHVHRTRRRIVHPPGGVAVELREVLDERPVHIVDLPLVEPDPAAIRAVPDVRGTPRADIEGRRIRRQRDGDALRARPLRQGAVDDPGRPDDRP